MQQEQLRRFSKNRTLPTASRIEGNTTDGCHEAWSTVLRVHTTMYGTVSLLSLTRGKSYVGQSGRYVNKRPQAHEQSLCDTLLPRLLARVFWLEAL